MLQVKHFPLVEGKINDTEFNEFIKNHSPKQNDKQSGLIINPSGVMLFYEDGVPYPVQEQISWIDSQIGDKKREVMIVEVDIRIKKQELEEYSTKLADAKEAIANIADQKVKNVKSKEVKDLEKIVEEIEAFIKTTEAGQDQAKKRIVALTALREDILGGTYTV